MAKIVKALNTTNNTIVPDSDVIVSNALKSSDLGGTTTYYTNVSDLPISAPAFTKALVTSTNTLYQYNGGWYPIALINNFSPVFTTTPNATYSLATNGSVTTVTVLASDSDDVPLLYTAVGDSDFNLFATVTHDSEKHNVWTITPLDSENGAAIAASGTVTFRASDGVNIATSNSTFSLTFGPDWSATPTESILRASDAQVNDRFGDSVSISSDGTYAIVGARDEAGGAGDTIPDAGAAYIFTRSGSTWTQQAKITASDAQATDRFSQASISSDGTYAIVGAYGEDTGGSEAGAAYIFTRSGSTWTQQQKIVSSDLEASDQFGESVSISSDGTYAIVGARTEDGGIVGSDVGAAYVFTRSGSTWTQQAKLTASDAQASDFFGYSVSISSDGTYAIVGAYLEDGGGNNAGAAYIFTRSGSTWTQQAKITANDSQADDNFGWSVSISSDGSYAIVGARTEDTGGSNAGAAYIFTRSGSTWTEQQKIQSSDKEASDFFGYAVALNSNGTHAIVGALLEDGGAGNPLGNAGAAYIFSRSGSTWTEVKKLTASDAQANDQFGKSVSISSDGSYAIVGARDEAGGVGDPLSSSGSAYIYEAG